MKRHDTREGWLRHAVELLGPRFAEHGLRIPETVVVLCSWSLGSRDAIGMTYSGKGWNRDGSILVTISPALEDPIRVLDVLVHELLHACGLRGHRGAFRKYAVALGLRGHGQGPGRPGKFVATEAGPELAEVLAVLVDTELGPYPHTAFDPRANLRRTAERVPRFVEFVSTNDPGYRIRLPIETVETYGEPDDPWGDPMTQEEP